MTKEPIPFSVFEAAVRVAGDALHFKKALRFILREAGVAEAAVLKYEHLSKYIIMRSIWSDLDGVGTRGRQVQHSIIQALANLDAPEAQAPNQEAGRRAIDDLRRLAKNANLLIDPEEHRRRERVARREAAAAARDSRTTKLQILKQRFDDLAKSTNVQSRGYAFERLLTDLFLLYELDYSGSFRTETDQIDGWLNFDAFPYLVEARWRTSPAVEADLAILTSKAERRINSTRGLFISMAGFRPEVVSQYRRAKESRLILVDGEDMALIFEGRIELPDALQYKVRGASHEGEPHVRLATL